MKKSLFTLIITACTLCAFICLPNYAKAQTTVSTENFDDGVDPPDNITYGTGNDDWIVDDGTSSGIPNSNGYAGASGNYFLWAADVDGSGELESITYTVSTRAYGNLTLQWGAYTSNDNVGSGTFPTITLKYSTDGVTFTSVPFTQIASNDTWGLIPSVSLPAGASNATTLYLQWSYNSDGNEYFYAIDDIQLSGTVNTYFSKSSGNLDVLTNWGINFDGTGLSPANFTTAGITYEIINNASATIGAAWTVSGAGSKVRIGDATTVPTINFTVPSGFALTGTVDVQNNGTLTIQNSTAPTLGTLSTGSTVNYGLSGAQTIVKPPAATVGHFYNLTISGSGAKSLPASAITVDGTLNVSAGTLAMANNVLGTLTLNGPISCAGTITGAANAQITIANSGAFGTIAFTPGSQTVSIFKINRTGAFTVTLGSDITVTKTFEHDGGGTLDLNGHSLTVNATSLLLSTSGAATISGSSTSNLSLKATGTTTGSLYMTQTSTATSSLSSLTVNSSLTLGNNLNIIDSIVPKSGTLTTGGNLTLLASQTTVGHTGRIGVVTGSISGNVISQVYHSPTTNNTDWRLMGVAGISNATFSSWNSQFAMSCPTCPNSNLSTGGSSFSSITTYNEAAGTYPDITYSGTIAPGTGYWVYLGTSSPSTSSSPILISVTGTAKTGAVAVSLTSSGAGVNKGDNLVANPYPSPISFTALHNTNAGISNAWYTYSPAYGDNAAYVGGVSTPAYSYGSTGIDATIPAGMGFFVVASSATTLNFVETVKTSGSNEELLRESNPNKVQTQLTYFRMQVSGNNMMNEAVVRFDPNATTGYDGDYDLYDQAPGTPGWIQISTSSLGQAYSVNSLPDLTQNYSIPVTITSGTTNSYQFTATDLQNIPSGACLKLHDKYTGTDYDLHQNPSFNLTINDTETVARFVLNVTVAPLTITTNAKQASCNNSTDGLITAVGTNSGPWNYTWRNASGTIIKTSLNKATTDSLAGLNNGVYSVDVTTVGSCDNATQTFTITAPAAPVSLFTAPTQANIGSSISLTNNSSGASNYIWNFGNGDISSLQTPTYAYNMPGLYKITLSAINASCNDTTKSTQTIQIDATTGIKQANSGNGDITISRDASGNYLQFDYTNQTYVSITVYNVLGQVLLNNASLHVVNDKIYLNINDNTNQVLYVTITNLNTNQQTTKKFVND